ncbi:MAG TPA: HEAT repeat domain-containing protein, partial [Pirellulales bacterium]|nr:HEAT repeat domain-containing protein [Pirellulales bacterium]
MRLSLSNSFTCQTSWQGSENAALAGGPAARHADGMAKPLSKLISLITPKRRWAQFGVGTMLLAVTALCILLADYVSPIRRLERQLRDPDEEVRLIAAERLGYLGPEARSTTKSLLRATDDESQEVCVKAVWALSRVSGRADLLAPLLTHDDDEIRLAAVEGMLWTGDDRTELVPMLLEMDPVGRADVGAIFEALGPAQAAIAVPILLDSLSPADGAAQRDPAAATLSRVGAPAATVVPALIDRLSREQPHVRKAAAEQLLRLGQLAKEAAPALRARLHDPDLAFAAACAAALGAVDPNDDEFLA